MIYQLFTIKFTDLTGSLPLDDLFFFQDFPGYKDYPELNPMMQLILNPKDEYEYFPCPSDATYRIDEDEFIVEGSADAGGYGSCIVRIPLKDSLNIYEIKLELFDVKIEDANKIKSELDKLNIEYEIESKIHPKYTNTPNIEKVLNKKIFGIRIKNSPIVQDMVDILNSSPIDEIEVLSNLMEDRLNRYHQILSNQLYKRIDSELKNGIDEYVYEILEDLLKAFVLDMK